MTELILLRHGETDWNIEGRYQGQSDVPLNQTGLHQADAAAASLQGQKINAIYSSDLSRARQTAEVLAASLKVPLQTDPRLREIDQGEWEGMLFTDIERRFAEAIQRRRRDPLSVHPPGGETLDQVRKRVLAAVRDIIRKHPKDRVVIVSHGLALALLKVHANNLPMVTVWDQIPPNAQPEILSLEVL